jgi:hypothetical protein
MNKNAEPVPLDGLKIYVVSTRKAFLLLFRTVTLLYAVFLLGCCDRIGRFVMDVFIREKITVTFVEYLSTLFVSGF